MLAPNAPIQESRRQSVQLMYNTARRRLSYLPHSYYLSLREARHSCDSLESVVVAKGPPFGSRVLYDRKLYNQISSGREGPFNWSCIKFTAHLAFYSHFVPLLRSRLVIILCRRRRRTIEKLDSLRIILDNILHRVDRITRLNIHLIESIKSITRVLI